MITLCNAENALKSIYLGVMTELLNTKTNPLLTKIEQTCADVWGKEIRTTAHIERDNAFGVGDESGELPAIHGREYIPFVSTLKNLYGQITISDKAIRVANSGASAFTDSLDSQLESLLSKAKYGIGQMLYGDGTQPHSLTGIGAIFDMTKPLYGQERNISSIMQPLIKSSNEFADIVVEKAIDELAERGANIDYISVSQDVKYAYMEQHKNIDIVELDGGFKALSYHGIPLVYDRFIPQGTMYLLDTNVFKLHQLCDWRWLESENGKILRESNDGKEYTATLVKYCDLICHRPDWQGMIKFTENN